MVRTPIIVRARHSQAFWSAYVLFTDIWLLWSALTFSPLSIVHGRPWKASLIARGYHVMRSVSSPFCESRFEGLGRADNFFKLCIAVINFLLWTCNLFMYIFRRWVSLSAYLLPPLTECIFFKNSFVGIHHSSQIFKTRFLLLQR